MPNAQSTPGLVDRYLCIVDRDAFVLAAVVSSYLFDKESYIPLFMFPPVTAPRTDGDNRGDNYLSNCLGNDTSVLINNAWARMGGSEFLILAGLSQNQKSYLSIPKGTRIVDVTEPNDVPEKFAELDLPQRGEIRCRASEILRGLFVAQSEGKKLVIDDGASVVSEVPRKEGGLIVVENCGDSGAVIGVNYASCVGANLLVVDAITKRQVREVHGFIQKWKESGDNAELERVKAPVRERTKGTLLSDFEFVTFFTEGLPYSLVMQNSVPCSYVHLALKPDLFVFNCIIFERLKTFHSAVVFSPVFFETEETHWLVDFFKKNSYYLRQLIGRDASFANLDFALQHFPYSVLHICSHGGEVDGWEVAEEFVDREGKAHVIEYDEVVGYDPVPDENNRIRVHRKTIFRKLDGFDWMSEELDKQNIASHVYEDMRQALYFAQKEKINADAKRKKKGRIASSCAIRCCDTIHQGELSILASHSSPFIFNNTCWSWYEVAKFLLACGARGYIGTFWAIDNDDAVIAARAFYEKVFSGTVLRAFSEALKAVSKTSSKDIYIYWGLHFSTLSRAANAKESRSQVFAELLQAVGMWQKQLQTARSSEARRNAARVQKAVIHELNTHFGPEDLKELELEMTAKIGKATRAEGAEAHGDSRPIAARPSMEHPVELRTPDAQDDEGGRPRDRGGETAR
jgi:hypothetical protein